MPIRNDDFTGYIGTAGALEKLEALAVFVEEALDEFTLEDGDPWKFYRRVMPQHLHMEGPEDIVFLAGDPLRYCDIRLVGMPDLGGGIQGAPAGGDRYNVASGIMQESHTFRITVQYAYREANDEGDPLPYLEGSTYNFYRRITGHEEPLGLITRCNLIPSLMASTGEEIFLSNARRVNIADFPLPLVHGDRVYAHQARFDLELT